MTPGFVTFVIKIIVKTGTKITNKKQKKIPCLPPKNRVKNKSVKWFEYKNTRGDK